MNCSKACPKASTREGNRRTEKALVDRQLDPMIDHLGFLSRTTSARKPHEKALEPPGYVLVMEVRQENAIAGRGLGIDGKPTSDCGEGGLNRAMHVAIAAKSRSASTRSIALRAAGARDNGAPGLRPQYHPNYYGAFVLDPDGHNIEAACHAPA
jgi:hypothetical protein